VFETFVGEHPSIIAQEKGFFKAQGVDVELIYKRYTRLEVVNLIMGEYDVNDSILGNFYQPE
jgi:NitT/TauT family transport system substrate-binding protein